MKSAVNGLSSLSRRTTRAAAAPPTAGPRLWLAWCARPVADERAALLLLLALPLLSVVPAFLLAVGLTAGCAPSVGTLRSGVAGPACVHLTLCLMWLPAYGAGYLWFWWRTGDGDDASLMRRFLTELRPRSTHDPLRPERRTPAGAAPGRRKRTGAGGPLARRRPGQRRDQGNAGCAGAAVQYRDARRTAPADAGMVRTMSTTSRSTACRCWRWRRWPPMPRGRLNG